ncbi:Putative protein LCHN/Anr2 [Septoria linicola]|uniref:DUF4484 domain-containing protein n=1 Tax=Septoria linicola TaxID=215465 RepID=A0A9Q9EHH6_9PEZI|nr:putative protein LCHN/Anr2 [Septoria linicola]USW49937.1 Putative protein LCHN/Anr2 [Septoria linicola]
MNKREDKPPVAAVFQVVFDQKVGYTIAWKRSVNGIDLEGVEFKSLPSGLHAVKEDLVYFLHGGNAGISVFVQEEADARHRNANFVAVGALVPLNHGQLGQSWAHAEELRRLAKKTVGRPTDTDVLQSFWEQHRADNNAAKSSPASNDSAAAKRKRAASEATLAGFNAPSSWPLDHPALHAPAMLETFGPLLFPLHRAALARQRVLFLGGPSVQKNSNTVYLTSILSTISKYFAESLPSEAEPLFRSSPLFSVGVHDIPELSSRQSDTGGWIGTSTDEILGDKKDLYDLLIRLPSHTASSRTWPEVKTSSGRIVKASQRDLRRWTLLRRELRRLRRQTITRFADESPTASSDSDHRPLLERRDTGNTLAHDLTDPILPTRDDTGAVEPPTWSAMAYRGFMWWASAGDVNAWESEESTADEELLFDMPDLIGDIFPDNENGNGQRTQEDKESEYARAAATLLVAYFRRVTEGILRPMGAIVEAADDATEEGVKEDEIEVGGVDLRAMGLDSWSEADKGFVKDMMKTWFGRDAVLADNGLRVCGVRMY